MKLTAHTYLALRQRISGSIPTLSRILLWHSVWLSKGSVLLLVHDNVTQLHYLLVDICNNNSTDKTNVFLNNMMIKHLTQWYLLLKQYPCLYKITTCFDSPWILSSLTNVYKERLTVQSYKCLLDWLRLKMSQNM